MSSLCYIQARGGSKRFPRKALALWNGKPMVADAIEKAKATGLFDYIAVSSDDPEILQVAVDYGVLPLWRSAKASSDTATDDDVAKEVLGGFNIKHDIICKLYPCIPLIEIEDIKNAYSQVRRHNKSGAYLVDTFGNDAGACYIFWNYEYKGIKSISLNIFPWTKLLALGACDINTPEDLEIAKMKAGK